MCRPHRLALTFEGVLIFQNFALKSVALLGDRRYIRSLCTRYVLASVRSLVLRLLQRFAAIRVKET